MTDTTLARPREALFPGLGFGVVALMALALFVNYVDRGTLSTAAPLIKDQFHLNGKQLGLLLSAFFYTYTAGQMMAGWLADRLNAWRTLALGVALWSLATTASGFATGFVSLFILRLVLGLGEAAIFPCNAKLLGHNLPPRSLGLANGLIGMGLALGPAFGSFVGGHMMAAGSWQWVFIVFGLASLVWLVPWFIAAGPRWSLREAPEAHAAPPPYLRIIARREVWGAALGHFGNNYAFYFVITWLPTYFVKARGFSMAEMAGLTALIYLTHGFSSAVFGGLCDRLIKGGASVNAVRKGGAVLSCLGAGAGMLGCAVLSKDYTLPCLLVAALSFGLNTPTIFSIGQTLGGPRGAGRFVAVHNTVGNFAGVVGPVIAGWIVDATHSFTGAFALSGLVVTIGALGWGVIIPKVEAIDWGAA